MNVLIRVEDLAAMTEDIRRLREAVVDGLEVLRSRALVPESQERMEEALRRSIETGVES